MWNDDLDRAASLARALARPVQDGPRSQAVPVKNEWPQHHVFRRAEAVAENGPSRPPLAMPVGLGAVAPRASASISPAQWAGQETWKRMVEFVCTELSASSSFAIDQSGLIIASAGAGATDDTLAKLGVHLVMAVEQMHAAQGETPSVLVSRAGMSTVLGFRPSHTEGLGVTFAASCSHAPDEARIQSVLHYLRM